MNMLLCNIICALSPSGVSYILLLSRRVRFATLVDTPEDIAAFRAKYKIFDNVEIQHCELGEWLVINRPPDLVVISMITFLESGMEISIGRVTRDFLINYRLSPTQCSLNLFRVLGSVNMINRKMGTNLT